MLCFPFVYLLGKSQLRHQKSKYRFPLIHRCILFQSVCHWTRYKFQVFRPDGNLWKQRWGEEWVEGLKYFKTTKILDFALSSMQGNNYRYFQFYPCRFDRKILFQNLAHVSLCRGLCCYVSLWENQRDNVRVNVIRSSSIRSGHNATFNSHTENVSIQRRKKSFRLELATSDLPSSLGPFSYLAPLLFVLLWLSPYQSPTLMKSADYRLISIQLKENAFLKAEEYTANNGGRNIRF